MTREEIQAVIDKGGWIVYEAFLTIFKPISVASDGVLFEVAYDLRGGHKTIGLDSFGYYDEIREATEEEIKKYTK